MSALSRCVLIATGLMMAGCDGGEGGAGGATADAVEMSAAPFAVVPTLFETPRDTLDNIDSPAVWHGPAGEHWLLATAKEGDVIVVSDAATGTLIQRVGSEGSGLGQFSRPNGIAVTDSLMWIVERDNARVQLFSLPGFEPLGTFGETELRHPYGIALVEHAPGDFTAYITDNYEFAEDIIPADSLLGERVRAYRVAVGPAGFSASLSNTFGDTAGEGRLRVVESLAADAQTGMLVIAEEERDASTLKIYSLDGRFTGRLVESSFFPNQAEGIVLYACGTDQGYWIATDQGTAENTFHIFDRTSLAHIASFRLEGVLNTDGIALTQTSFGPFPAGAFFAVHNDGNVVGASWAAIATALGIRADCVQ